ncbi:MAG: UDP-N-acetylglucosamine 2-epimerase (hydrolyzing) [Flavobacteriaceae bacterium TMED238]|nr:MAG: UDP-N-acetylglucosamine 2-epimerase (hydrolyzing) [Flavobacteriaceae bacterium TMED238]|tara:strand:+ start:10176 stop:11342 length:1167 start_codon:yes stop_codon:yes gene_type:complete
MRKISVISSSRADYGLLKNLLLKLKKDKSIKLNFYVTGAHLIENFGKTINQIKEDKIKIKKKILINFNNDKHFDVSKAISQGIRNFSIEFEKEKPDILLILGDRYEIFSAAIAAMIYQIPIAHLHGGESTEGAIDESIRHSISKMSHIHFVSTKKYSYRLCQMGENKKTIFDVGSLGVENIKGINLYNIKEIKKKYKINLKKKTFVITLHPETLLNSSKKNTQILLNSLKRFKDINFVFTMPNADTGYKEINKGITNFCKNNKNSFYFKSLGQRAYFSICKYANCVIGNSSSAIIEAPSLFTPSINIGIRQQGRVSASTVINSKFNEKNLTQDIKKSFNLKKKIKKDKLEFKNPYEKKGTSSNIVRILKSINLDNILIKKFKDYEISK